MIEWVLLILGSLIIIISYVEDYVSFMIEKFSIGELFMVSKNDELMKQAALYVPQSFSWLIFIIGELLILTAIFIFCKKNVAKNAP